MAHEPALPQLVRSRVRFAHRGLVSVRLAEGGAVAFAAWTSALAAAVVSGASLARPGAWWAAGISALLAGGAWIAEHHLTEAKVARGIDRGLGEGGALFTAWEVEGRARAPELGHLLSRSVAERAPARRMLRAVLPLSAPLFALPFLGAVLLFLALEDARSRPALGDLEALSARLGDELTDLSAAGPGAMLPGGEALTGEERSELAGLARAARDLRGAAPDDREALLELRERMAAVEAELPLESEIRRRLERAEETLDSALMALEGVGGEPTGDVAGGAEGLRAEEGGDRAGSVLAPDGDDVRMLDPISFGAAGGRASERGVLSGPGWSEAYDEIVARWIAATRADGGAR